MRYPILRLSALVLAMASVAPAASAPVEQQATHTARAAGSCQPAREYPELRVRQLEMDNIGGTNAYVICTINARLGNQSDTYVTGIRLGFFMSGEGNATIRCTLKDQWGVIGAQTSYRKEVELSSGETASIAFDLDADGPFGWDLTAAALQCILPPDTSAIDVITEYTYVVEVAQ